MHKIVRWLSKAAVFINSRQFKIFRSYWYNNVRLWCINKSVKFHNKILSNCWENTKNLYGILLFAVLYTHAVKVTSWRLTNAQHARQQMWTDDWQKKTAVNDHYITTQTLQAYMQIYWVSEWVSSFLMAHQHIIGHEVARFFYIYPYPVIHHIQELYQKR